MTDDDSTSVPDGASEAVVTFHPQVWVDNRAVTGTDTVQFVVPIEAATDDDGELLPDNSGPSDRLREHPNAPDKARLWQGPFYVTIDEVR